MSTGRFWGFTSVGAWANLKKGVVRMNGRLQNFPSDWDVQDLVKLLAETYGVQVEDAQTRTVHFYDTFEWSLWFSGHLLCLAGGRLQIRRMDNEWLGEVLVDCPAPGKMPRFAWESRSSASLSARSTARAG